MRELDTRTCRDILDIVDQYLINGKEADQLWSVLSASRGPDEDNDDLKQRYTIPIRRRAFPLFAQAYADFRSKQSQIAPNCNWPDMDKYECGEKYLKNFTAFNGSHFYIHIEKAWKALNPENGESK